MRGTVGALTVMTAIGASIREMAGMGVFGVMTMMIGARVTPLTPVGMMAGARTIRSMSYACLWMRQ